MTKQFKNILTEYKLKGYVDSLIQHWSNNPPTLGHGALHAFRVAVNGYRIAEMNKYDHPEDVFVIGLFHDIYRPADGKDGEEDQSLGATYSKEILEKGGSGEALIKKVIYAIESHDEWREGETPEKYVLYFSLADKSTHKPVIYEYAYASNKGLAEKGLPPRYTSHLDIYAAFTRYQLRAWDIFMKYDVKGKEKAINAYIDGYREVGLNYQKDPIGADFEDYLAQSAQLYLDEEKEFLLELGYEESLITKIQRQ